MKARVQTVDTNYTPEGVHRLKDLGFQFRVDQRAVAIGRDSIWELVEDEVLVEIDDIGAFADKYGEVIVSSDVKDGYRLVTIYDGYIE